MTGVGRPEGGLIRSSAIVAVGTGLSRVTGLLRTMALAYALGTLLLGDAYNLANWTPNVIYDLVLGGILAATLVPVIVDRLENDDRRSIDALATTITMALVGLTVIALAASPLIIRIYTVFADDPSRVERQASVALPLLFLFMPQVLFYGISTLWTAILNAHRSFAAPAFAPVLNNVMLIALFIALPRVAGGQPTVEQVRDDPTLLLLLGLGTTSGIVAMTLVLWPAMRRAGIRLRWNPDWRNPAIGTVARLSGWTFGYVIANQVVFFVVLALITGTGTGAPSAYTYAWQFFQLPVGLFTVSIMTTFTPELAMHASRGDLGAYRERFVQGLRLGLLVVLPTVAVFTTLATPVVALLFERGAFGAASTDLTSSALLWLALGLPGFTVFLYTMRGFYAFKNTRTPFFITLFQNGLQISLAFALVGPFGMEGVLGAFSASYTVAAVVALALLRARTGGFDDAAVIAPVIRQVVAAAGAAGAMLGVAALVDRPGGWGALIEAALGGIAGLAAYLGVLVLVGSPDLSLVRTLGKRQPAGVDNAPMP
jgi:putative peptidoglycan lipid II flippase